MTPLAMTAVPDMKEAACAGEQERAAEQERAGEQE